LHWQIPDAIIFDRIVDSQDGLAIIDGRRLFDL
jgi:hypothetical protein